MNLPKVMIGAPVRDRAWILPRYLDAIYKLDYPRKNISLCFILNDSTDDSKDILFKFMDDHNTEYASISIEEINFGTPKDIRYNRCSEGIYTSLASLRNELLDSLNDEDYFFSIDSDIIVPAGALKRLINDKRDIVAGVILNSNLWCLDNCTNVMLGTDGDWNHLTESNISPARLEECFITGAVYLISQKVVKDKKVRYGSDKNGEDIVLCENARKAGYTLWFDSGVICAHNLRYTFDKKHFTHAPTQDELRRSGTETGIPLPLFDFIKTIKSGGVTYNPSLPVGIDPVLKGGN